MWISNNPQVATPVEQASAQHAKCATKSRSPVHDQHTSIRFPYPRPEMPVEKRSRRHQSGNRQAATPPAQKHYHRASLGGHALGRGGAHRLAASGMGV